MASNANQRNMLELYINDIESSSLCADDVRPQRYSRTINAYNEVR